MWVYNQRGQAVIDAMKQRIAQRKAVQRPADPKMPVRNFNNPKHGDKRQLAGYADREDPVSRAGAGSISCSLTLALLSVFVGYESGVGLVCAGQCCANESKSECGCRGEALKAPVYGECLQSTGQQAKAED